MTTTVIRAHELEPIGRSEAVDLGLVEYRRLADALRALGPDEWARQTDCTAWDVRALAGHVTGMMWSSSGVLRFAGEQVSAGRRAKRDGIEEIDAMTAIQVERMAELSTGELVDRIGELAPAAAAGRRRMPGVVAGRKLIPQVVNDVTEKWSLAYLYGIILTRDTWLHRVADVARAVGRPPQLDPAHDGHIVADVVAEWARRHGQPFELTLTGPAGGRFRQGEDGPSIELDAVEFCRMLSGRATPSHALLETQVPF